MPVPVSVEPTLEAIEAWVADAPDAAVDMLNLLRFTADGGAERYAEYGRRVASHLDRVGGRVLIGALSQRVLVAPDAGWDAMALVHYPSRRGFLEMVTDPSYAELGRLRAGALDAAVLQATTSFAPPAG